VELLADLLAADLSFPNGRGRPLSPLQQLCTALNYYAGHSHHRVSPLCGGVSQTAAYNAIRRVTEALARRQAEYLCLPDEAEMEATAARMQELCGLPRFAFAVEGVFVRFEEAPRGLPEGKHAQMYLTKKQFHALNCQLVTNDQLIYDLDCNWHGRTPNAKVWSGSAAKTQIEAQKRYLLAGDAAYPISENLIRPYGPAEAKNDDTKAEFNRRLAELRAAMPKAVARRWKQRFPCLDAMRNKVAFAQKVVIATAVLHNLAVRWEDQVPEDETDKQEEEEEEEEVEDDADDEAKLLLERTSEASLREKGERLRDQLREAMMPRDMASSKSMGTEEK
jgi:hypothetical protein